MQLQRSMRFYALLIELLRLFLVLKATNYTRNYDFEHGLLDLSLTELLRLKKSLNGITIAQTRREEYEPVRAALMQAAEDPHVECNAQDCPQSMALARTQDRNDRGGYANPMPTYHHYHHPWQPEEKTSKLQTLFQISITALAFLSFGGYLLCLIVQAIKSKGTTYFHPVATATTAMLNGNGVKRIKIYRRSRRWTADETITPYPAILPWAYYDSTYLSHSSNEK